MNIPTVRIEEMRRQLAVRGLVKNQGEFNQYFTPGPISKFMASLFTNFPNEVTLLDPGFGLGILSAAFVDEVIRRNYLKSSEELTEEIKIVGFEIDSSLSKYIDKSVSLIKTNCLENAINIDSKIIFSDFIMSSASQIDIGLFSSQSQYSHVIMNPPYGKINGKSVYKKVLSALKLNSVNLYSAFVMLGIKYLQPNGEIVAIIPRSFCNGPYYEPFRSYLVNNLSIRHIHTFTRRNDTFKENNVLQETIIFHGIKKKDDSEVLITSSESGDFFYSIPGHNSNGTNSWEGDFGQITNSSMTMRKVKFEQVVHKEDPQKIFHISPSDKDQLIIDRMGLFTSTIEDISVQVSTGPIVDFRMKKNLQLEYKAGSSPLIYPGHAKKRLEWPIRNSKPNAIEINDKTKKYLWINEGSYVVVHRFSSKEEKRRIKATVIESGAIPGNVIAFDNKLNIYHDHKCGFDELLAKGLYLFLNSTLVDEYFRQFSGHTQVNANDLRILKYPSRASLKKMGKKLIGFSITQDEIDSILDMEIMDMGNDDNFSMKEIYRKKEEALDVLISLGMPKAQQNERTALTLLALLNLSPQKSWKNISNPMIGITPIMDWVRENYKENYAPNTRETFRRQSMHQLLQAGLVVANPDDPKRAINSPHFCYQITPEFLALLRHYGTENWKSELLGFLSNYETLKVKYQKERKTLRVPLKLHNSILYLSSGKHSELIKDIVEKFKPNFANNSELLYLGDTGGKEVFFHSKEFEKLGLFLDRHGKMPDVVLIDHDKKWIILLEAVTSHGPVDSKRYEELTNLFHHDEYGLVFITCFPDKSTFTKYLAEISWETDVWISDNPGHLIHFDGKRFLGPY